MVLAWIAMAALVQLWLVVLLDVVARLIGNGVSGWSPFVWPSLLVALVGTQLFGFLADTLSESRSEWSTRAVVGFWVSVLVLVPLSVLLTMVSGLFG